jgi:integrase
MANKAGHRRFGNIRKLPSGRYQIRYRGTDGRLHAGADTYESRAWADRALSLVEAQMTTGEWSDPVAGQVRLSVYADRWIAQRVELRPATIELYRWLLARHINPSLGEMTVAGLTPDMIREWRAGLIGAGVSESAAAKAYRLLRAVLMTATEDRIIPRNPCRIRGAGEEKAPERPVLTVAEVFALADKMKDHRYRALVLLATFASLRWGEAIALQRSDIDQPAATVRIRRQYVELRHGHVLGPPKSRAGVRTIAIPQAIMPVLAEHLDSYVGPDGTALVFTGALGGLLRRGNFRRDSGWSAAAIGIGMPGLHFHDLRHTGNTLAAQAGASLADLKARMGHDSARAAMIYQHATSQADHKIAAALTEQIQVAREKPPADRLAAPSEPENRR